MWRVKEKTVGSDSEVSFLNNYLGDSVIYQSNTGLRAVFLKRTRWKYFPMFTVWVVYVTFKWTFPLCNCIYQFGAQERDQGNI